MVVVEFGFAFFPFQFAPQWPVVNDVRYADGQMTIGPRNRAQTSSAPAWVGEAREYGTFGLHLDLHPAEPDQRGPARIFSVAEGATQKNLAVSQDGADLVIQLRRAGSSDSGEPRYVVPGTFAGPGWWRAIVLDVGDKIQVTVDGKVRITEPLPPDALGGWDPAYRLMLGNSPDGERPWVGELRRAEIETRNFTVDYTRPGALEVPRSIVDGERRSWEPLRPDSPLQIAVGVFHMLIFAPLGIALRRLRHPPLAHVVVLIAAAGLATAIQLGKTMFAGRHPAVADIIWLTAGAVLGSICAGSAAGGVHERHVRDADEAGVE